jgi:hypothetical protein
VRVLEAAKHCASTVPKATSLEDIHCIIGARQKSKKNYMMMETAAYTREFLLVEDHYKRSDFGSISFAHGSHVQDMEGWLGY